MTKTKTLLASTSILVILGAAALAQGESDMAPLNNTDRQYLIQSAQGSVSDYANGAAGVQSGGSAIRQYGVRLMEDHNRLNIEILQMAGRRGLALPLTIADADKTKLDSLTARKGIDFDREFLRKALETNAKDVADAQKELAATADPEVRMVVSDFLNTERAHLAEARQIQAAMGAVSGRR